MANFRLSGDIYVSKSGSNANTGTDPDNPKLTIQQAIDSSSNEDKIIIGDGVYEDDYLIPFGQDRILEGDGIVVINRNNQNLSSSTSTQINLIFININNAILKGNAANPVGCTFINCANIFENFGASAGQLIDCRLINSTYQGSHLEASGTIFINSQVLVTGGITTFSNCYIDGNSIISISDVVLAPMKYNNFEGNIIIDGNTFDLSGAMSAYPTLFAQGNINVPILLNREVGEILTLDFTVEGGSPLLGAGENGTNIGGVRRGLPQTRKSTSIFGGVNSNIVFDGNKWLVKSGETTGNITSKVIDFGLTVKSPILRPKGIVNFLDNVPDFDNALTNPNKLDMECRWAIIGEDITMKPWKTFLINERMLLDASNKSNGETGFDWNDAVIIPMKEIQLRITLRQNYNPA